MSLDDTQMSELIQQIDEIDYLFETQEFYRVDDDGNANTTEITCWGCREGILNQLGHMDYGGCLYQDDVIETMSASGTVDDEEEEEEEGEQEG